MIGYYVHHQGSGHLQQLRCISDKLRTPVTVLSSLDRPSWWEADWIKLPRDDEGTISEVTANGVAHWAPLANEGLRERGALLAEWIRAAKPAIIVTDVSVEVAILARLLGVPVVVAAMRGDRADRPHSMAYDLAYALLAPWNPVFAARNWPAAWLEKTWHVGAFSEFDELVPHEPRTLGGSAYLSSAQRRVFVLWGAGGADVTVEDLQEAQRATPDWHWSIAGFGHKLSRRQVWEGLTQADVVIAHAGHNVVAEIAALRKPAIVVAQPRPYGEHRHTVAQLRQAGLAVGLDRWPRPSELSSLLESTTAYDPSRWQLWNAGRGAERAARCLDRAVKDLRARYRTAARVGSGV